MLRLLIALIIAPACLMAQSFNQGLALYGIMHEKAPCKRFMEGFGNAERLDLSILWHTFGQSFGCLDMWAADERPKSIQVHMINEVCQRNKRCGPYEVLHGVRLSRYRQMLRRKEWTLQPSLEAYLQPISSWLRTHPSIPCNISMGLESNLPRRAYRNLVEMARPHLPYRCSYTWNPLEANRYGNTRIRGMYHEIHGSKVRLNPPCYANLDGEDMELRARPPILSNFLPLSKLDAYLRKYSRCKVNYLWIPEFNANNSRAFIDPRLRSGWPSKRAIKEINSYLKR